MRNQDHVAKCAHNLLIASVALLVAGVFLLGCTVGPNYKRPQVSTPTAFRGSDNAAVSTANATSLGDQNFAQVFHEPELQDLIRTALTNNFDVRIAAQHVLEQQAQLRITRSQQFPTLTVGGSGIGADLPSSLGSSSIPSGTLAEGSFNLSAAWTPDFWGLYRRQTEAARAQLLSQTWAQRAVRMTLVEQVATAYLQLRALDDQRAIARSRLVSSPSSSPAPSKAEAPSRSPICAKPKNFSIPQRRRSRSSNRKSSSRKTVCVCCSAKIRGPWRIPIPRRSIRCRKISR
jgi:multidrug efflux system outer membrane protein